MTVAFVHNLAHRRPFEPFTVYGPDGVGVEANNEEFILFSKTRRLLLIFDVVTGLNHVFYVALISRITSLGEVELTLSRN